MPSASPAPARRAPRSAATTWGGRWAGTRCPRGTARRRLAPGRERLLDVRDRARDQHQVLARVDRPGAEHVDRGALDHRVARSRCRRRSSRARSARARAGAGRGWHGRHQTIRSAPTTVIRRSRENVRGRVMPSPDGTGDRHRREALAALAEAGEVGTVGDEDRAVHRPRHAGDRRRRWWSGSTPCGGTRAPRGRPGRSPATTSGTRTTGQHRHHLLGPDQAVVTRDLGDQEPRLHGSAGRRSRPGSAPRPARSRPG